MKPQHARKLYDALVSGKYTQCGGVLKRTNSTKSRRTLRNGHCCIGVASEELHQLKVVRETGWRWIPSAGVWRKEGDPEFAGDMPSEVSYVLGMARVGGKMIRMNDERAKGFDYIAERVRKWFLVGTKYDPKPAHNPRR